MRLCTTCDHYIWLSHFLSTWYLHTPPVSLFLVEQLIFSQRTVHPRVALDAHSSRAQVIVCVCTCVSVQTLSRVQLFVFPWTVAHQNPLSREFSRQEYWGGLLFPSLSDDGGTSIREDTYTGGLILGPRVTVLRELSWRDWASVKLCVNKKWTFFCSKPLKFWGIFVIAA